MNKKKLAIKVYCLVVGSFFINYFWKTRRELAPTTA